MCESLWGKLKDLYKEHEPKSQIQTLGINRFKKGDGSAPSFNAKAAETKHLVPCRVKLAEELKDRYNTEHILHALHCCLP